MYVHNSIVFIICFLFCADSEFMSTTVIEYVESLTRKTNIGEVVLRHLNDTNFKSAADLFCHDLVYMCHLCTSAEENKVRIIV